MGEEHGEGQPADGDQAQRPPLPASNGGRHRAGPACAAGEHHGGDRRHSR